MTGQFLRHAQRELVSWGGGEGGVLPTLLTSLAPRGEIHLHRCWEGLDTVMGVWNALQTMGPNFAGAGLASAKVCRSV